jgi:prephenate dehydratase
MTPTIAIQGFAGSFHQLAAHQYFGPETAVTPCATFAEVVRQVARGTAAGGVMAIENSIAGSILPNYNLLQQSELRVTGEVYLPIRQHLLLLPGQTLADLREVHSHPMALLQCADFLNQHPEWKLVETEDTALSAQRIREGHLTGIAAVAGQAAAELFDLEVGAADIQSVPENYTRFLIINTAENAPQSATANKASVYFHTSHTKGSLARVLNKIADHDLNLSKLQSFPQPGRAWQYFFHADLEFDHADQFHEVLRDLEPLTEDLRVLGLYQRGDTQLTASTHAS